jgi:cell division protein FtsI (penicillin-binding protein 3)
MKTRRAHRNPPALRWRAYFLLGVLTLIAVGLTVRAVDLQLVEYTFLSQQGDARFIRTVSIPAHRGEITDRYGEPLAVSTPVDSIWVNPRQISASPGAVWRLASAIKADPQTLRRDIATNLTLDFLYVARQLPPPQALRIKALGIPGVYLKREYRTYYPAGEVTGQLIGFTNIDNRGQAGLELAYDPWLTGLKGEKQVIEDRFGRIVQNVAMIRPAHPGHNLVLSIDMRIQYLAYEALKAQVAAQQARSGSMVVIDIPTGEVLAMVDQPGFNPNDRSQLLPDRYRNRALTDDFEPGSAIKPFFIAAALMSGRYNNQSIINTSPGYINVDGHVFRDDTDLGPVDISTILAKSSNVGMAHIALSLSPRLIWRTLRAFGFGQLVTDGYPGEAAGILTNYHLWRPIHIATMSHGYGLSVTALQLAHAYATLGGLGLERPISFLRVTRPPPGRRIMPAALCRELLQMMRAVISPEGTAPSAAIPGYSVAGKTGTSWELRNGTYDRRAYNAVFAGVAPVSAPRLAAVVVIRDPHSRLYYGGLISAPVFSEVIGRSLRLLGVAPDEPVGSGTLQMASLQ